MASLRCGEGVLRLCDGTRPSDLDPSCLYVGTEIASEFHKLGARNTILTVNTHRIYVGQVYQFSKVVVGLDAPASADTGKMVVEYWNGRGWVGATNLVDGTAVGNNTMRQNGVLYWDIHPSDWSKSPPGDLFYIRMRMTNTPAVAPAVRLFEPASGQFIYLPFVRLDAEGPQGRSRPPETTTKRAPLAQPPERVKLSCLLSNSVDRREILKALRVDKLGSDTWPLVGKSTKTLSKIPDGTGVLSPTNPFLMGEKTVDVQIMWYDRSGQRAYWEWQEVYFDLEYQSMNMEDGYPVLILSGDCYGAIRNGGVIAFGLDSAA